jgi:hypothetical protein
VAWYYLFEERYDNLSVILELDGRCLLWPQSPQTWMGSY